MLRERSYQLRTLTLEHTCSISFKNPRYTSSYIGKKLMKNVKRQPNIKLRDIQEKYTINISARKASRTRDKAKEYVDEAYTQQYNQL